MEVFLLHYVLNEVEPWVLVQLVLGHAPWPADRLDVVIKDETEVREPAEGLR